MSTLDRGDHQRPVGRVHHLFPALVTLSAVSKEIGGGSALAGAGLIGATIALGAAFVLLGNQARKAREETKVVLEEQAKYFELIAEGSQESINQQIAENQQKLEIARSQQEALKRQFDESVEERTGGGALGFLEDIGIGIDKTTASQKELQAQLEDAEVEVTRLEEAETQLTKAREDATVVARQATQELLGQAAAAGENLRIEQDALARSKEANAQRLQAIEDERAILDAQIAVLQASGDTSQEVTERITELTKALGVLSGETDIINNVMSTQTDTEKERTDALKQSTSALEDNAKKQADAQKKLNDDLVRISAKAADEQTKIETDLRRKRIDLSKDVERDITDANKKFQLDRLDLQLNAQHEDAQAFREHQSDLIKIQRDAQKQREGLLFDQDFRGLFELEESVTSQLNEANDAFITQQQERKISLDAEFVDLQTSLQRERDERLVQYSRDIADAKTQAARARKDSADAAEKERQAAQSAYDQQLKDLQGFLDAETKMKQQAATAQVQAAANAAAQASAAFSYGQSPVGNQAFKPVNHSPARAGLSRSILNQISNSASFTINGAQSPQSTAAEVRKVLREVGIG
jgi:hypothetical protein